MSPPQIPSATAFPLERSRTDVALKFTSADVAWHAFLELDRPARNWHGARPPLHFEDLILLSLPFDDHWNPSSLRDYLPKPLASLAIKVLPVYIDRYSGLRQIATDEIGVRLRDPRRIGELTQKLGLRLLRGSQFEPREIVVTGRMKSADDGESTWKTIEQLRAIPDWVESACPNFVAEVVTQGLLGFGASPPPDGIPWHLGNAPNPRASIHVQHAWSVTQGEGAVVAVVDTGVDLFHDELRGNLWQNPDPKSKDKHGRDYTLSSGFGTDPTPSSRRNWDDRHGTFCAGVIAARGNNRLGVIGVAPRAKILTVKVGGLNTIDRFAEALRYAGHHADVVSCSWVQAPNEQIQYAINDIVNEGRGGKGCLVFACTGNSSPPKQVAYPARYDGCFAIGASTCAAVRAPYSNFGDGIAFVAPSCNDYKRPAISTIDVHGKYIHDFGGTSAACALAAGIGALLLSANPGLSHRDVADILRQTAERIDPEGGKYSLANHSHWYGHGRLDAGKAVPLAFNYR